MNYEQRMKIIAAAIAAETAVTIDKNLEKGILDGFYRIDSIEKQEQKALDPLMPFHVERIQEGYGIWNSGGYDEQRRLGKSIVAAGPDGERLRQVRYKKEVNGDHSLAVIYPGCYIAQSVAFDYYESNDTTVYRVERIGMRDGWYLADSGRCADQSADVEAYRGRGKTSGASAENFQPGCNRSKPCAAQGGVGMTYYSAFLEWAKEQNGETFLCIRIPVQAGKLIQTRKCKELALGVDDGRSITPAQRRKAYATLGDISNYTGYTVEAAKEIMKVENMLRLGQDKVISLSDCTITEAREYINTLMEYSLKEGLILTESGLKRTDDIDAYLIQCIRYKRCCICGKTAEIHHVDAIGMGNDRRHVDDSERKLRCCAGSIIAWHIRKDGYSLPMRIKFTVLRSTGRQQEET